MSKKSEEIKITLKLGLFTRNTQFMLFSYLQVVEVLTESLTLKETPIPTKVARLMLVSDILHNSSAPVKNASAYRTKFEASLPDIMESFNDLYRSITGRITAEALKVSSHLKI